MNYVCFNCGDPVPEIRACVDPKSDKVYCQSCHVGLDIGHVEEFGLPDGPALTGQRLYP